jgi:hypothetical protein
MNGIRPRASDPPGRLVTRTACIRAREALRSAPSYSITRRGPESERIRAFCFSAGRQAGLRVPPERTDAHWRIGLLFNKLPRTRTARLGAVRIRTKRIWLSWQSATTPWSRPRVRFPVSAPHLIAGVLRHNGRACIPEKRGDGRNVRCRDAGMRAARTLPAGHRARVGAQPQ